MAARKLDRDAAVSLWSQLERDLRRRLEAGEFDTGRFPTDHQLMSDYAVSRHTVREAIKHLNRSGLLTRERGRGTVINRTRFEQSLGTLYSLFHAVESSGAVQTSEVLEFGSTVDATAASQLEVDADTELTVLERVRYADDEPLAIDRAWVTVEASELADIDWSHTALYTELERLQLPVPNQGWERLSAITPTTEDRKRLALPGDQSAFRLERLGIADGTPVEWRVTVMRGDRFQFMSEWSRGGQSVLRLAASDPKD